MPDNFLFHSIVIVVVQCPFSHWYITTRARVLDKERIILLRQITKNTFFKAAKMSQDEMHLVSYRNWWQRGDLHLSSKPPLLCLIP